MHGHMTVKYIKYSSCADGNLCPSVRYITQRDDKCKKSQKLLRSMCGQKGCHTLLWEAAEKPCGILEYHSPFKVFSDMYQDKI
jgi:hypothetical protein